MKYNIWLFHLAGNKCKQFYYNPAGAYQIFSGEQTLPKPYVFLSGLCFLQSCFA